MNLPAIGQMTRNIVTFSSEIWLNATALRNYRKKNKKSHSIFSHFAANQNSLANPALNRPSASIVDLIENFAGCNGNINRVSDGEN